MNLPSILEALLRQPTAPFHEDAVAAEIERLLGLCPHVTVERDDFGNRIATYRRGGGEARWAFAAHMDHPGWVRGREGWEFLGGVRKEVLDAAPRPPFPEDAPFAMWELPAFECREGIVHSRACDDLAGCAAIVSLFFELEAAGADAHCVGIFTRAEEVGFAGALELARSGRLPKTLTLLSLEASSERPPAVMGQGAIVRVGDRASIFDPETTALLAATAAAAEIPFQRCLMPGGICEATAYALYGYRCGALCVALGNYHNCTPEGKIAAETISLSDLEALTALCVALVRRPAAVDDALRERLEKNLARQRDRFFRPLS